MDELTTTESDKLKNLNDDGTMAGTRNVKTSHNKKAKTKIATMMTSTTQCTAPLEVENITLQSKENGDETELKTLNKQEGEVEILPKLQMLMIKFHHKIEMIGHK